MKAVQFYGLYLLASGACYAVTQYTKPWEGIYQWSSVLFLVFLVIGLAPLLLWIVIGPHELGHILMGKRRGYRFIALCIGGIMLVDTHGRKHWMFTTDYRRNLRYLYKENPSVEDIIWVHAAGGVASILCGLLLYVGFRLAGYVEVGEYAALAYGLYGVGSYLSSQEGWRTDGQIILQCLRHPDKALATARKTNEDIVAWLRPSNSTYRLESVYSYQEHVCYNALYVFWKIMDAGKVKEAELPIRIALESAVFSDGKKPLYVFAACEAAIYFARFHPEPELVARAEAFLEGKEVPPERQLTIDGAKLWAAGDRSGAIQKWTEAEPISLATTDDPALRVHTHDWFLRLRTDDMIFETERLIARKWRIEDVDDLFEIYREPEVVRFLGPTPKTVDTRDEMLEKLSKRLDAQNNWKVGLGAWALIRKSDEKVIGCIIFNEFPDGMSRAPGAVEVGWHLGKAFWNQGYAYEAARGAFEYGFRMNPELEKVVAVVYSDNAPSRKLAEKLKMKYVGQSDEYYGTTLEVYEKLRPGG